MTTRPYDYAAAGRAGRAALVDTPEARRRRDLDKVRALTVERISRGLPLEERRWSLEAMAYWVRFAWPKPRVGDFPQVSTIIGHLSELIAEGRLPPVSAWGE